VAGSSSSAATGWPRRWPGPARSEIVPAPPAPKGQRRGWVQLVSEQTLVRR
jgi:hypothetical protein